MRDEDTALAARPVGTDGGVVSAEPVSGALLPDHTLGLALTRDMQRDAASTSQVCRAGAFAKVEPADQAGFGARYRVRIAVGNLSRALGSGPEAQLVDQAFVVFVLREHADRRLFFRAKEPAILRATKSGPIIPI